MASSEKADAEFDLWLKLRTQLIDDQSDDGDQLQTLEDAILDRPIVDDVAAVQVGTVILTCLEDGEVNGDRAFNAMSRLLLYLGGRPDMIYAAELSRNIRRVAGISAGRAPTPPS